MNVGRILTLVQEIRELDNSVGAQAKLSELSSSAEALANEPQNQSHQTSFISKLGELRGVLRQEEDRLTTGQRDFLTDIKVLDLFSTALAEEVQEQIRNNGIAPGVVRGYIAKAVKSRQKVLGNFETLGNALSSIGVKKDELKEGCAELGFIVPRSLFTNHIKGLAKEIGIVGNVVRTFTEVVLGDGFEEPELAQLSTSDPIITMMTSAVVAAAIGGTVTWLLESYGKTQDLKRARENAIVLGMKKDVVTAYQDQADEVIDKAIKQRIKELMVQYKGAHDRLNHLEGGLKWAMETLLYRIERGMRVEVRYLPPPPAKDEPTDGQATEEAKLYAELAVIQRKLLYPEICGEPILQLSPPEQPPKTRKPKRTRAVKKPEARGTGLAEAAE